MQNQVDFQVTFNSNHKQVMLRLLNYGPRGKEHEIASMSRAAAQRLHNDLGAALRAMDQLHEYLRENDPAALQHDDDAEPEMDDDVLDELDQPAPEVADRFSYASARRMRD